MIIWTIFSHIEVLVVVVRVLGTNSSDHIHCCNEVTKFAVQANLGMAKVIGRKEQVGSVF